MSMKRPCGRSLLCVEQHRVRAAGGYYRSWRHSTCLEECLPLLGEDRRRASARQRRAAVGAALGLLIEEEHLADDRFDGVFPERLGDEERGLRALARHELLRV